MLLKGLFNRRMALTMTALLMATFGMLGLRQELGRAGHAAPAGRPAAAQSNPQTTPQQQTLTQPEQLDCVDPKIELPLTARAANADYKEPPLDLKLRVRGDRGYSLKFGKSPGRVRPATAPRNVSSECQAKAEEDFYEGGDVSGAMPAINFPEQPCEDQARCRPVRRAWMQAHHNVWVARQVLHFIASEGDVNMRRSLWSRSGLGEDGTTLEKTSPAYWFGPYEDYRFYAIKQAVDKLWNIFVTNKTGGISVKLRCPDNQANVCWTVAPSAHHIVKGQIDFCPKFFGRNQWDQARLMAHEPLHHLFLTYSNNGPKIVAIQDKHVHGHGRLCTVDVSSPSHYGETRIRHLVTYQNSRGGRCRHLNLNFRNNDTYAHFITTFGDHVYKGTMVTWPAPANPTPKPPPNPKPSTDCEGKNSWPLNTYFQPDGDFGIDYWCPDNDGEATCVKSVVDSFSVGRCKKCSVERGPGCECDKNRPCDQGFCFGDDTFNGGVGRCYKQPPPSWACLADCKRLFNDPEAYCYNNALGKARCMDSNCPEFKADECAQQGKVCRDGKCVVECANAGDCQTLGYPASFTCKSNRCEY